MGFFKQEIFAPLLLACLCLTTSASPARRAFDTSSADINNLNNVDTTIKEVENLLQADPSLPRLTRGEILDIIENLTRTDMQKVFTNNRDQKAIMVVMPYSADSAQNGDVQSLYTKPPITQIIGDIDDEVKQPEIRKKRPTKKPYQPFEQNHLDYTSSVKVAKVPSTTERFYYTEEQFQQQQSANIDVVTQKARTTTENPITRFINRRRKTTKIPQNHTQEIQSFISTTSTSTTTTTTTTPAPRTTRKRKATRRPTPSSTTTLEALAYVPESGINIIDPPTFHKLPETVNAFQPMPTRAPRPSTTTTTTTTSTTTQAPPMMIDEVQIPDDFKDVLKSLDILIKQSPTEPAPSVTNSPIDQLTEQDKLKLLFASLGGQTTTTTSTTTSEPDVVQVANNLTPEMKELLMTFGLIPDPNKDKTTTPAVDMFMEPSSVVNADSYSSFKPLPVATNTNPNEDMEDILAKFGLVDKNQNNREQKAISLSKPGNEFIKPNLDVIPDNFKEIITDIGFENAKIPLMSDSQLQPETEAETEVKPKKPDHVFNPSVSGTEYATQDEINRLNQLMSVIKQFEKLNGTASDDDLKHIDLDGLKDLVGSFNVPLDEQKGPNPLDFDLGLSKNEVKRQTSTETSASKPNIPINPSLALLEDSFGGPSDTVSEAVTTTTTEAPKRTGFYYLVDWNSFLDIDNQKGKRVNLRFQPTIGDPKRFFSVNVP